MLTSQYSSYEDVKIELESYLNEMGLGRDRQPSAARPKSPRASITDKITLALIPLLTAFVFVA